MHIANNITAAMSVNAPKVIFKSIEFGDPGDEEAAYRERFFESSWLRQQREKKRPLHRLFMHSVVTKGEGILKTIPRKNRAWAKYKDFSLKALEEMEAAVERGDIDRNSAVRVWDAKTEQFKRGAPYPIETTDIPPETFYYQRGRGRLHENSRDQERPVLRDPGQVQLRAQPERQGHLGQRDRLGYPAERVGPCLSTAVPGIAGPSR
jgi:hypothetical protein